MVENVLFNTWYSPTAVILTKDVSLFYHKHGNKKNCETCETQHTKNCKLVKRKY